MFVHPLWTECVFCALSVQPVAQPQYRLQPPLNLHVFSSSCLSLSRRSSERGAAQRTHRLRQLPVASADGRDRLVGFGGTATSARPLPGAHTLFLLLCVPGAHAHHARTRRLRRRTRQLRRLPATSAVKSGERSSAIYLSYDATR
jgi:hypothetical protein